MQWFQYINEKTIEKLSFFYLDFILANEILIFKSFLHGTVLGYLPKLKRGLGLVLRAPFQHIFLHKNVPCLIIYQLTKLQCQTYFLSQDIKQNAILNSCLAN